MTKCIVHDGEMRQKVYREYTITPTANRYEIDFSKHRQNKGGYII